MLAKRFQKYYKKSSETASTSGPPDVLKVQSQNLLPLAVAAGLNFGEACSVSEPPYVNTTS